MSTLEGIAGLGGDPVSKPTTEPFAGATVTALPLSPAWFFPEPEPFNTFVCRDDASSTLVLQGELDMATLPVFESLLRDVEQASPPAIILDLRQLRFLDCTGLRSFLNAQERIAESGSTLHIVPGPASVQRLFELTQAKFQFVRMNKAS